MSGSVSIVVPCLNEVASLPALISSLKPVVADLIAGGGDVEVIAVDDGSSDGSWAHLERAARVHPWLRVIRLSRNFGQTAALMAGFDAARGEVVVAMDADLQNDPADIPELLRELDEGYDVVSGWRRHREDRALSRRVPSMAANWLIARLGGLRLHDYGCTLKAYRRWVLRDLRLYGDMHRFIPLLAHARGARVGEIVVRHHPRRAGQSKYGLARIPRVLLDLLTLRLITAYATHPLRYFGRWAGLALTCAVVLFAVGLVTPGLVAGLGSVQLLGVGLLGELQVRTYFESQERRTYVVRERVGAAEPDEVRIPRVAA